MILIGLVSIVASALYYRAVGYNLFWQSMVAFATTGEGLRDFVTLRISTYSGEAAYFAQILVPAKRDEDEAMQIDDVAIVCLNAASLTTAKHLRALLADELNALPESITQR